MRTLIGLTVMASCSAIGSVVYATVVSLFLIEGPREPFWVDVLMGPLMFVGMVAFFLLVGFAFTICVQVPATLIGDAIMRKVHGKAEA